VRGFAASLRPTPAALPARPSSPSSPNGITHSIPSPKGIKPVSLYSSCDDNVSDELRSPRQGQAAVPHPQSKRRSRKSGLGETDASGHSNESRTSSAKPAAALGSKHAHSILHTYLIRAPSFPERPSSPPALPNASITTQPALPNANFATQRQRSPFRGFQPPSMSSNEMQV
jgi:hypothetical protein